MQEQLLRIRTTKYQQQQEEWEVKLFSFYYCQRKWVFLKINKMWTHWKKKIEMKIKKKMVWKVFHKKNNEQKYLLTLCWFIKKKKKEIWRSRKSYIKPVKVNKFCWHDRNVNVRSNCKPYILIDEFTNVFNYLESYRYYKFFTC